VNREQAEKLAAACFGVVQKHGPVTVGRVFDALKSDRELVSKVPLTVPTVSRSLLSLFKSRRVRLERRENTTYYHVPEVTASSKMPAEPLETPAEPPKMAEKPLEMVAEPLEMAEKPSNTSRLLNLAKQTMTGRR